MAADLCILFRTPPYGSISAAEGLRHLIGAATNRLDVGAILLGEGVWAARAGQEPGSSGWTSLSDSLAEFLAQDDPPPPPVYAPETALSHAGLTREPCPRH
ncbi:MAG: DsrE family protein [Deltaproteobacteria bacterium]|nr:DsrE family protein [Deltaproteobacteria bacterium]